MKFSKWLLGSIVLVVVVAVIAVNRSRRPPSDSGPESSPSTPAEAQGESILLGEATASLQAVEPAPVARLVLVRPGMMLVEVNGRALTLKDLMPVSSATPPELSIESDEFQALLQRAIERNLTFQTARSQGVVLTREQTRQLGKMRRRARAQKPELSTEVNAEYEAQANFDNWEVSTRMMQDSLFAASGRLADFVTQGQVDEFYLEHSADFEALPDDPDANREVRKTIDAQIRFMLAPLEDPEYQRQLRHFIDDLVDKANLRQHIQIPGE
jgi:hypothetical protein